MCKKCTIDLSGSAEFESPAGPVHVREAEQLDTAFNRPSPRSPSVARTTVLNFQLFFVSCCNLMGKMLVGLPRLNAHHLISSHRVFLKTLRLTLRG